MPFRQIRARGGRFVEEIVMIRMDGSSDTLQFDNVIVSRTALTAQERSNFALASP